MTSNTVRALDLAARVLIALLFFYSGIGKLANPGLVATRLDTMGFPLPTLFAWLALIFELGSPILLICGYRIAIVSFLMAGYTMVTALLFHQFWAADAAQQAAQTTNFLKNVSMMGGFWYVMRSALITDQTTAAAPERAAPSKAGTA